MEPVDDGVGFEFELGGQYLDGVLRGVGLQEVGLPQGFFLLSSQHHSGLLHLAVGAQVQRGQGRTHRLGTSAGGVAVRAGAQQPVPPFQIGWREYSDIQCEVDY